MAEPDRITEKTIQNNLYRQLRPSFTHVFPNMAEITMYEADLIAVSRAGYAYEYEIKLTLSDFRADQKKREKHASLCGATREMAYPYAWGDKRIIHVMADAPEDPYKAMRFQCYPHLRPKEFWYVTHGFEIPEQEIPEYAGLMRYRPNRLGYLRFEVIKQAPKLKAVKVDEKRIIHATNNMLYRYWELRLKEELF